MKHPSSQTVSSSTPIAACFLLACCSKAKLLYDWRSISMSWCRAPHQGPWPDFTFSFLLSENCIALRLGVPSHP
jgi:hypothetical protein